MNLVSNAQLRMPRVVITTSDVQDWCLRPLHYFMSRYWPNANVLVAGFRRPPADVPYQFHSIGDMRDYPYAKWSDAIIDFLNAIPDELLIWSMEDFWPIRQVDETAISMLAAYMQSHPHVSRLDLTSDREYAGNAEDIGSLGWLDLITNPQESAYTLSLQVGIWRRTELLRYLVRGENPHEVELLGTRRMIEAHAVVLGTRQNPVRVLIAVQNGVVQLGGGYQVPKPVIDPQDIEAVQQWIP